MLNWRGDENLIHHRPAPPVTVPALNIPPLDTKAIEAEAREAQARVRVIRAGRDAWEQIAKAQSFEGWLAIGAALSVGKRHALKVTGVRQAWGRNYSLEFSLWVRQHGFDSMSKSTRSVAIELHENASAIEAWRATLPERQRKRLVYPLSNVRRWRASQGNGYGRCPADYRRDAMVGWRKFVSCVSMLPADDAAPLWRVVADAMAEP